MLQLETRATCRQGWAHVGDVVGDVDKDGSAHALRDGLSLCRFGGGSGFPRGGPDVAADSGSAGRAMGQRRAKGVSPEGPTG